MSWGQAAKRSSWAVVVATVVVGTGLVVWAVAETIRFVPQAPRQFWLLAALAVLVDTPVLGIGRGRVHYRASGALGFAFAILVQWGPGPAIVVQALAAVGTAVGQRYSPVYAVTRVCRRVVALGVAALPFTIAGLPLDAAVPNRLSAQVLLPLLVLTVVWSAVDWALLVPSSLALLGMSARRTWNAAAGELLTSAATALLVAPLLLVVDGWWSAFVALPLLVHSFLSRRAQLREEGLYREPVTGMLDRQGLQASLEETTIDAQSRREPPPPLAVALVNVESVLRINRALGRDLYERVVVEAARRLAEVYGLNRVGRLSGEGYVVFLPKATEQDAADEAAGIARILQPPLVVDGIPFALDPAVGVALYPQDSEDFTTLVIKAELAVGQARQQGVPVQVYVREAADQPQRRIAILAELYSALRDPARHDEVAVSFQPQVELAGRRLAGAEALVRWTHPVWGPVPPDELIAAVEPSEVMHLLTRHMLERVCAQVRSWNQRGLHVRVAVNASMQDLRDPHFPAELSQLLGRHRIEPGQLTIEITETMLSLDMERISRAATRIAALGVGLSLDDFGTGYASMQQLRALPLTEVKIDKSYVGGMTVDEEQYAIVAGVHQLASALHLSVVAEGVEDERTASVLAGMPGTIGQGWHFGRPVPAAEFEARWAPADVRGRWDDRDRKPGNAKAAEHGSRDTGGNGPYPDDPARVRGWRHEQA